MYPGTLWAARSLTLTGHSVGVRLTLSRVYYHVALKLCWGALRLLQEHRGGVPKPRDGGRSGLKS